MKSIRAELGGNNQSARKMNRKENQENKSE